MRNKIIKNLGHITFVIYLCLFVLIPITHCHAADVLSENTTCVTKHGLENLPFFSGEQCCELHESDHTRSDEHHIHFLTDDQVTATRNNPTDISLAQQILAAVGEIHPKHFLSQGIGIVVSNADFYQEALRSYSSARSPPLS